MKTLTAFSLLILGLSAQPAFAADERPNILLAMVDDMGCSDLGCYGGERPPILLRNIRSECGR